MNLSPLDVEAAPRSRVLEWLEFAEGQAMFESYKAEEAAWRAANTPRRQN